MKRIQYSRYFITNVDTDGLVLQYQGISSCSAELHPCVSSCLGVKTMKPVGVNSVKLLNTDLSTIVHHCLTHVGLTKMSPILQTTFSNAFSWNNDLVSCFKFHNFFS